MRNVLPLSYTRINCNKEVQRQSHREGVLVLRTEPVLLSQEHCVPYKLGYKTKFITPI